MRLEIRKSEVLKTDMSFSDGRVPEVWYERFYKNSKAGKEHYTFLAWLVQQFNNSLIYEFGYKAGASALCLASNPSNKVVSFDIYTLEQLGQHKYLKPEEFMCNLDEIDNFEFRVGNAREMPRSELRKADLIFLDADHRGKTEEIFLKQLRRSKFKGLLVMDDVQHRRFKELQRLWEEIPEPKWLVPFAHWSGTGLVSFGDFDIEIIED